MHNLDFARKFIRIFNCKVRIARFGYRYKWNVTTEQYTICLSYVRTILPQTINTILLLNP